MGEYLSVNLDEFEKAGRYVNSPEELFEVTKKEQAFLLETGRGMKDDIHKYEVCNMNALHAAVAIAENPELSAKAQSRAEEALTEGVLSRGEVLYMFRSELNPDKILQTLDKRFEEHHINTALSSFRQEKLEADNIKDFLKAAGKEQEFLTGLQGTLKYTAEDKTLQKAIDNAVLEHKEGIIEKLAEAGKYCLANGIKTEREIVRELDATIDAGIKAGNIREAEGVAETGKEKEKTTLKGVYVSLDRICENHLMETFLKSSESAKKEAGTLKDMLKAIAAEQEYLAKLHNNLKYPDSCYEDILYSARRAAEWRKEGIVPKLEEIARKCISSGAKDENTIVSELKILDNAEASYNMLNVSYGAHHVITNSEVFRQEKQQAKTLDDMLKIITREQDFLAGLHNNKEYSDGYTKKTADIIKAVHEGQQNNIMKDLRKITEHITGHKVMPEKELLDRLADDTAVTKRGIGVIINELSGFARDHYSGTVNRNMVVIAEKGHIEVHGKKFDCAVKYLKHEIAHPAHEYADIARFKKSLPQVQEKVQQMQLQPKMEMSKKQEKVYNMGGRSM